MGYTPLHILYTYIEYAQYNYSIQYVQYMLHSMTAQYEHSQHVTRGFDVYSNCRVKRIKQAMRIVYE